MPSAILYCKTLLFVFISVLFFSGSLYFFKMSKNIRYITKILTKNSNGSIVHQSDSLLQNIHFQTLKLSKVAGLSMVNNGKICI